MNNINNYYPVSIIQNLIADGEVLTSVTEGAPQHPWSHAEDCLDFLHPDWL